MRLPGLPRRALRSLRTNPSLRAAAVRLLQRATPAAQAVTRGYRKTLLRRTRVVAVVGSYGKTTTTRALSLLLVGSIHRYLQNNSGVWALRPILSALPGRRHVVIEVGIDGPGQMRAAARAIAPDLVVVTCIGSEHNRSFASLDATRDEKCKMVEELPPDGVAVLNGDDERVRWMASRTAARVVTFGEGEHNDVRLLSCRMDWPRGSRVAIGWALDGARGALDLQTRLIGRRTMTALLAAVAIGLLEGLEVGAIQRRLEALEAHDARLQVVPLGGGAHLVRDELKSNEETVDNALDVLAEIPARRKILVLGEVAERTTSQGKLYRRLGERATAIADRTLFLGSRSAFRRLRTGHRRAAAAGGGEPRLQHLEEGVLQAVGTLRHLVEPGDVVLIKGRDTQRLQRVSLALLGGTVACTVRTCQLLGTRCDCCSRLATGWHPERHRVP